MKPRPSASEKQRAPIFRVVARRDFALLWAGSFISFLGSQIQGIVQGFLVYEMTGDKAKLAFVWFCASAPVSFFGPFLGVLGDMLDRRRLMYAAMLVSSAGAFYLAYASYTGTIQFWHFVAFALLMGFVQTVEVPTRQSIVRSVVPAELMPSAVPLQAMAFNGSRVMGPALGGLLLGWFGATFCFTFNGISFLAVCVAVLLMRADLRPVRGEPQPVIDLILDGARYTLRDKGLRTLFFMEAATSMFGMVYLVLLPAIAKDQLGLDEKGLGVAMSFVGVGAFISLVTLATISHYPIKRGIARLAMVGMSLGLVLLSFAPTPALAFPVLFLLGASGVAQFNTTNTLFQLLSPEHLRGRVIAMHMWAISGTMPIGVMFFGWIAKAVSLHAALIGGGAGLALATIWAYVVRANVQEPQPEKEESAA